MYMLGRLYSFFCLLIDFRFSVKTVIYLFIYDFSTINCCETSCMQTNKSKPRNFKLLNIINYKTKRCKLSKTVSFILPL